MWYNKRRQLTTRSRQLEVFRKKITEEGKPSEALLEKLPAIKEEPRYNHRKVNLNEPPPMPRSLTEFDLKQEMRPASPSTMNVLYDGFTKEGKGRYKYLKLRYEDIPETKFQFPVISSWEYGWHQAQEIKKEDIKKPENGRTANIQNSFYTRNGVGIAPKLHCS
ncbi:hypothetical protein C0Q70_15255 [Pomacea canaliculata]|uniref:Sperm microtubule inner protein 1 C-terminal domain-containing protein n=1 Tax=Pomacea canaliculata TaxID=400727 RepID=A0A2T7NUB1_POMCA|nr:hypothetical protein C0Q70_15255 [Pomacea canaliculata]